MQKKNLMKYALIAFVLYLVWRKMSSGYTAQELNNLNVKAGVKIGNTTSKNVDLGAVAKNVGTHEYCLKTTGTKDCRIAEKAGMKIGSVKAGEIGLKSDAVKAGEIGIDSAKTVPACRFVRKCPKGTVPSIYGSDTCFRRNLTGKIISSDKIIVQICDPLPVKEAVKTLYR